MRKASLLIAVFFLRGLCFSQDTQTDSLLKVLNGSMADTARVNMLNLISKNYFGTSNDKALAYARQAKDLSEKSGYIPGLATALKNIGIVYYMQSNYVETLTYWNQSLEKFEAINDKNGIANVLSNLGAVYFDKGDDANALDHYLRALKYAEETGDTLRIVTVLNNIGAVYINKPSSHEKALTYYLRALPLCELLGDKEAIGTITVNLGEIYLEKNDDSLALKYFEQSVKANQNAKGLPYSLNDIAKVYEKSGDYKTALDYHSQALEAAKKISSKLDMSMSYLGFAHIYSKQGNQFSAVNAFKQSLLLASEIGALNVLRDSYEGLSKEYEQSGDYANAYKYQVLLTSVKDSLYKQETDKKIAVLQFNSEISKKEAEIKLLTNDKALRELDLRRQTLVKNSLIAVLSLVTLIVFILFRNYRIKDKTNYALDQQKNELQQTLNELKNTQTQLIQSEKMASLGELTAGIAHEIQNPLNFVNNFSEVSVELAHELSEELHKTPMSEPDKENLEALLGDLVQNQEKINFHGKRAQSIIVSMLQHSRSGTGKMEPVEINSMADEYLRLAFHGLKAKDKTFNAEMQSFLDKDIGTINIIPQEIGRVLLNLYNNAFYSVIERCRQTKEKFVPTVTLITKKLPGKIEIRVHDNGNGIPQKVIDKIFQPFFTTKPTGQGTGLGLSMSYDIIKAHGGNLRVDTKEGEFAEFIIELPTR